MNESMKAKEAAKAVWGTSPAGWIFGNNHALGSKPYFDAVLEKRFSYECDWLDEIVKFKRFKGKKVLEIGCGAGYDAYQFCKQGADYTGIDITPANPLLTRQHLSYYGYSPKTFEMDVESMEFDQEFDQIYSFGVLHHVPNMQKAINNCYEAIVPGGEAQIIVYNKYSIFYLFSVVFAVWLLRGKFLYRSLAEQRGHIEYSTSGQLPLVNVYSKRAMKNMLTKAGFEIIQTDVRKLVHEDLPGLPIVHRLYKYIPQHVLSRIGRYAGWYISIRALKK
jgi:SAM-dependent methyltransferase